MGDLLLAKSRIRILALAFTILLALLSLQLFRVQIFEAANYKLRAVDEMETTRTVQAPRGEITDVNGVAFARSVSAISIVVDQTQINNPAKTAAFVAPILGLSVAEVQASITGTRKYSMVLKNGRPAIWSKLSSAMEDYNSSLASRDLNERIIGFFPERSYIREYPSGQLISSLVGFVRADGVGATGLESSMNSIISGTAGRYSYARANGAEIPGSQSEIIAPKAGTTVRLTIDRDVQWVAAKAIAEAVKITGAANGTVIVMDPRTGAIIAHATAPTFDPNNTKGVTLDLMRNPSVQDVYEPGSTGKVMTMAAALEEKTVTPTTVFSVPYGLYRAGKTFHDHERHATQHLTTTGILAVSSNTGSIQVGETLGSERLYEYLTKFGIGTKTGSGLPGESAGILRPVKNWSGTTAPTVAFGQGYSLTAMQATSVFATIANGGVRVSPTVIAGTSDSSGHFTPAGNRDSVRVVSEETAAKLRIMMESVVSANGTAPSAAIPGYRVAGKTGTAQRVDPMTGKYSGYTASFIGFAPADSPRYVINVTLQRPRNGHFGGSLCGPVFKKVMTFVLQSEHVSPTGTKVLPVALTQAQLKSYKATQVSAKN
ncbi:FtsI Cell division protein FtsI/penicillin-binding protein 2 [Candidatus Nanopelagicaceae bacterium]